MKNTIISYCRFSRITAFYLILPVLLVLSSCKKFIEIAPPASSLEQSVVFKNNGQATSAVAGMYSSMNVNGFASGNTSGITLLAGLSSDEMIGYNQYLPFQENELDAEQYDIHALYFDLFQAVYRSNVILEGLRDSESLTTEVKRQLEGETRFLRAFGYFQLVNLFGPVPLNLVSDYRVTQTASRASESEIYSQIFEDLRAAEELLSENYVSASRGRVNRSVAQALLARAYLYRGDWENSEKYASIVIGKSDKYQLEEYDKIFLMGSKEAIWQISPQAGSNAMDGNTFIPQTDAVPFTASLQDNFVLNAFESGDKRRSHWIGEYTLGTTTYYYPFKYKVQYGTEGSEGSIVFRLAELYLIRSEARLNRNMIVEGVADLNKVRLRMLPDGQNANGISSIGNNLSKEKALEYLEAERKRELFTEWGHRWFDLKRTGRLNDVLSAIKLNWEITDALYPIPASEVNRNNNVKQNQGY